MIKLPKPGKISLKELKVLYKQIEKASEDMEISMSDVYEDIKEQEKGIQFSPFHVCNCTQFHWQKQEEDCLVHGTKAMQSDTSALYGADPKTGWE